LSTTIDERVVEMRFDNRHFESNVKTTMSTLDKLKEKLHFKGATKGLENVGTAAKNVNMSGLGNAVETVSAKFSALQVMGVTALANITNSAVNAGKRMVSALTIDPVKTGFSEYETKINSIQTILSNTASKGTTMEDVTRVINELNTYADKTIYNFAEMTRNIGTFTAAGVGLEESAAAIQGIANLAAASGSTSQQASTAMYQLSQAISTGTVRLMDWNSVVNAGMGGELFQEAIKQTAREYGVAVDDIIAKNGSFRDSLQEEWLSAEILNTTLKKFTVDGAREYAESMVKNGKYTQEQAEAILKSAEDMENAATKVKTFTQLWDTLKEAAQSGWSQTWELVVGDFYEARDFLTGLSDTIGGVINASAEARNKLIGKALGSKWEEFIGKVNKAGIATEDFEKKLRSTAKENGFAIDDLIEKHGSLSKAIEAGAVPAKLLTETFLKFTVFGKDAGKSTEEMTKKLEYFQKVVDDVWRGDYGDGEARIKALTDAGYDYAAVQELVNKTVDGHRLTLNDLSEAQLESLGYTKEQIEEMSKLAAEIEASGKPLDEFFAEIEKPSGRELLIESFQNILKSLIDTCGAVKKAWREVFWGDATDDEIIQRKADFIYKIIEAVHGFTKSLQVNEERAGQLVRTFKGVFAIIDIILTIVGGPLRLAFKALLKIFEIANIDVLEFTASIGDAIVAFRDWIDENNIFLKAIEKIGPFLKGVVNGVKDWIAGFKDADNIPKYLIEGLINGFKTGIMAIGKAVYEFGKGIIEKLKNVLGIHSPSWITFEMALDFCKGFFNGLKEGATSVWNFVKGIGLKCIEIIKGLDFGTVFAGILAIGTLSVLYTIGNALKTLAAPLAGLGDMFEEIGDAAKIFAKGMKNVLNAKAFELRARALVSMAIAVAILAGSIYLLSKLDPGKLWATIGAIAALAVIIGLLTVVASKFTQLSKSGSGIANAKGALTTVTNLVGIAGALLLAAIAMKKLSDIDLNNIPQTLTLLAGIVAALGAILLILGKFINSRAIASVGKVGWMVLQISAAILLMTFVIKQVAKLNPNEVGKGLTFIAGFGLLLNGLITVLNRSRTDISRVGGTLIKVSIAILLMVGIIKIVSKMDDDVLRKGTTFIATVTVLFMGILAVSRIAGEGSNAAGSALIKMSAAILILVMAVGLLSMLKPENINKGLTTIIKLELIFAALIAATHFAGPEADKVGGMLMKISISLLILTGVIFILGLLNPKNVAKALGVIGILGGVFAALIVVTKYAQNCHKNLLMLVIAVGLLATAIIALSFIDTHKALGAAAALTAVIGAFALLVATTKVLRNSKGIVSSLATMIGAIVILTGIVYLMSLMDTNSALSNAAAVSTLIVAMSGALFILGKTPNVSAKALGNLTAMGAIILELCLILSIVETYNLEHSIRNVAALSTLLLAMSTALLILKFAGGGDLKTQGAGMLAIAVMGLVLIELAGVLKVIEAINPEASMKMVLSLSVLLLALTGVLALLALVGTIGGGAGAFTGILALIALIAAMGLILVGLGALMKYVPEAEEFINTGSKVLVDFGTAIGGFLGAIVGGIIGGIGAAVIAMLPSIGESLSEFMTAVQPFVDGASNIGWGMLTGVTCLTAAIMFLTAADLVANLFTFGQFGPTLENIGSSLSTFIENAKPFIDGAKNMDSKVLNGVSCLASAILMLTASNLMDSITRWISGDASLATFSEQLPALGTNMREFTKELGTFDDEKVKTVGCAAEAIKLLAEAASVLPNEGGWLGAIVGENSLDKFGGYLPKLAEDLKAFVDGLADFDKKSLEKVKYGAEAIKAMAECASAIPNEGGWLADILGDNSISKFGADLSVLGTHLSGFVAGLGDFDATSVETAKYGAEAVKVMADVAKKIPNEGGFWASLCGDNSLSKFGADLSVLGTNLSDFVSNLGGFGPDSLPKVQSAVDTISTLANLSKTLPNDGGLWGAICGNNGLGKFSGQLPAIGTDLRDFANNVGTFTTDHRNSIASAMNVMKDLATLAKDDLGSVKSHLGKLGPGLVDFGSSMGTFCSKMTQADSAGALKTVANLQKLALDMSSINVGAIAAVSTSLSDVGDTLKILPSMMKTSGAASVTAFISSFTELTPAAKMATATLILAMAESVKINSVSLQLAFAGMMTDSLTVIGNARDAFYQCGKNLAAGLAQGVRDNSSSAVSSAQLLAERVTNIVKSAFKINSPSKVFAAIGSGLIEGLVKGIHDNGDDSLTAINDVANTTSKGFSLAISKITDMLNSDLDMSPTIRPVLDLSNIKSGAGTIGGILNGSSVGMLANVGAISASINGQNGESSELISAINKLRKDLGNIGNTTNIINGVTYDDGSNINNAVASIVRAAKMERRR
jgi:tape measure domain-containing protein